MKTSPNERRSFRGAKILSLAVGITLTVAVVLMSVMAGEAWAATVIRMGHVGFPGSLLAVVNDEYAKRINEALKGRYEVKVFHSSQLGSDEEISRESRSGSWKCSSLPRS